MFEKARAQSKKQARRRKALRLAQDDVQNALSTTSIDVFSGHGLRLSALKRAGVTNLWTLKRSSVATLTAIPGVGEKTVLAAKMYCDRYAAQLGAQYQAQRIALFEQELAAENRAPISAYSQPPPPRSADLVRPGSIRIGSESSGPKGRPRSRRRKANLVGLGVIGGLALLAVANQPNEPQDNEQKIETFFDQPDETSTTTRASSTTSTRTSPSSTKASTTTLATTTATKPPTTAEPTTTAAPTTAAPTTKPPTTAAPTTANGCDPNYSGCVPVASDVDCAGGSGNGPAYVRGPVRVVGADIYGLDRDGDGVACE